MNLRETQSAFQAQLLGERIALPAAWAAAKGMDKGLAIYRNAYRTRLVASLEETYPRLQAWLGKDSFRKAAAHHFVMHPPTSWTLDLAGARFPATIAELMPQAPEAEELAWLEWHLRRAYVAADCEVLDASQFGAKTKSYTEDDWADLGLSFIPSLAVRPVTTACAALWRDLARKAEPPKKLILKQPGSLLVWCEDMQSVFRIASAQEGSAVAKMVSKHTFGELCEELACSPLGQIAALKQAGTYLRRWIQDGLVTGIS